MSAEVQRECLAFLICFAVKEEAAYSLPFRDPQGGSEILITGMGRRNASRRLIEMLDRINPERVITCGFAGALNPKLKLGDVLFDEDFESGLGERLRRMGASPGSFYCATRVAVTAAEKVKLWHTTGMDAVEMESAVIRTLCRDRSIPSATIRVVSDTADEDLPLDFNALMTSEQRISMAKLALALVKSPRSISHLLDLQRNTRLAARKLGETLKELLADFSCTR
jgi:adenosylhomocysteine nucleosidase